MNIIVEITKYLMILLIAIYTYYSFAVFRYKSIKRQNKIYIGLTIIIFTLHFFGNAVLYIQNPLLEHLVLYGMEVFLFVLFLFLNRIVYPKMPRLLIRNMLLLLSISFIVLTRINISMAVKQVIIVACSMLISLFVPYLIKSYDRLKNFGWYYGAAGIILLLVVLLLGKTSRGATNWLYLAGISLQPSEFVKLFFVFCIAALFHRKINLRSMITVSAVAGIHVLILVLHKDLGGALIFFVTFVFMLYVATANPLYLFGGLISGSAAAYAAYQLFYHVRVRFIAWENPFAYIDKEGYQITQSLFAIGTGGWFGMGLKQGLPTDIPVVESDFIFSAISEELGGLFSLCLILIYISCFVMFLNVALKQEEIFYRLVAVGFAVMFVFQMILSIGGVTKFIPSTGVTLPLISQGGSSVMSTIIMFMILQGISIKNKGRNQNPDAVLQRTEGGQ